MTTSMKCPQCSFEGEFRKDKVPFFTFSLLDSHIGTYRARKTGVCPKCGCEVMRTDLAIKEPRSRVILYGCVLFLILGTFILLM